MAPSVVRLHARPVRVRPAQAVTGSAVQGEQPQKARDTTRAASQLDATAAALEQEKARVSALAAALERATAALEASAGEAQQELPRFAVDLALGIAQEILRKELDAGQYDIEGIVRSTLAVADTGRSPCTIHLHPEDLEALDPNRFRSNTRFESDPDIARGDVHVNTPQGLLVRDVDAILSRIREELTEANR